MNLNRTQIYLEPGQQRFLRGVASQRSTTISRIIREAINELAFRTRRLEVKPSKGLGGIIGIYRDETDREGSVRHDDVYD